MGRLLVGVSVLLAMGIACTSQGAVGETDDGSTVMEPQSERRDGGPITSAAGSSPGSATSAGLLQGAGPASSFVYWLQEIDLTSLRARCEPLAIIDYSRDGTDDGAFTREEIEELQATGKTVLAYMSIGEAEDYRFYWRGEWGSPDDAPDWLERENPNWAGNFKVRYWDADWQRIILGLPSSYLDKIMAAGFDGVYLDIIDGYAYFEERGRETAEAEMVAFVRLISTYAKERNPDFLIVPQNAPELGARIATYLEAVDGVGQEGLHYGYDEPNEPTAPTDIVTLQGYLDAFRDAGKLVLVTDYVATPDAVRDAYERSWARGYWGSVTDIELDRPPFGAC